MNIDGWVTLILLLALFGFTVWKFSSVLKFLIRNNSEDREKSNMALRAMESAIREASGTTNIFQADVGHNQTNSGEGQGNQGQAINKPTNKGR